MSLNFNLFPGNKTPKKQKLKPLGKSFFTLPLFRQTPKPKKKPLRDYFNIT